MADLILLKNPLRPFEREVFNVSGNFLNWLVNYAPSGFGGIATLIKNGEKVEIDDWDFEINDSDLLILTINPAGEQVAIAVFKFILYVVISAAINRLLYDERIPTQVPGYAEEGAENTVYSISPKQNAARIGGEIPVNYGRPITTPDYASQPYTEYTRIDLDALSSGGGLYSLIRSDLRLGSGGVYLPQDTVVLSLDPAGSYELWESDNDDTNFNLIQSLNTAATIDPTASVTQDKLHIYDTATSQYIYGWFWDITDTTWSLEPSGSDVVIDYDDQDLGNGEQYLYYLLCVGMGEQNIDQILLADTDIDLIQDENGASLIDWETYTYSQHNNTAGYIATQFNSAYPDPGLFHENIYTSVEVGTQVFDEPFSSPFFPLGNADVNLIRLDISFDAGFYRRSYSTATFLSHEVTFAIYVLDRDTDTIDYFFQVQWLRNTNSLSPLRRTLYFDVAAGKYSVSVRRISPKSDDGGQSQDSFRWAGLRGDVVHAGGPVYSKAQMLAMRIRASEYISEAAQSRVRCKVSRLLPTLDGSGSSTTESPARIVRDIFTNSDYGGNRPVTELDLEYLTLLNNRWANHGASKYAWSGVFNGASTVFEALKTVLLVGAAQPLPVGNQLSFASDGKKDIRVQLFSSNNIVRDSFRLTFNFDRVGDHDGIVVEYRDPDTWQPAFEKFPSASSRPQSVNLFGCANALLANEYAEYLWSMQNERRVTCEFQTELEGLVCRSGDRIGISHWISSVAVSGMIIDYDTSTLVLTLDREIASFGAGYYIVLRDVEGVPTDPIPVTYTSSTQVEITDTTNLIIPIFDKYQPTPTHFSLGAAAEVVRDFVVREVTHDGDLIVSIRAEKYITDFSDWGLTFLVNTPEEYA